MGRILRYFESRYGMMKWGTNIFAPRKAGLGVCIGLIIFAICFKNYSIKAGVLFFIMFLLLGSIHLKSTKYNVFFYTIWCVCFSFLGASASQLLMESTSLFGLGITDALLETTCVFIAFLSFFVLMNDVKGAAIVSLLILASISLSNLYVYKFRGSALVPLDFLSIRTAGNVLENYHLFFHTTQFYGLVVIGGVIFSAWCLPFSKIKQAKVKWRCRILALDAVMILTLFLSLKHIYIETWGNQGADYNGYFVNFGAQLVDLITNNKLKGYSIETVENIEKRYITSDETTGLKDERTPTIIAIMDESFSDLSIISENSDLDQVMPFFNSLNENIIKGYALSSVYGGGTANSEYEFLTGNTLGFLANGATVYQLYLNSQEYSIASYLKNRGYKTVATHPYLASGWSRTKAWPYLGFENITFIDCYPQKDLVRGLVSDKEAFKYIVEQYEKTRTEARHLRLLSQCKIMDHTIILKQKPHIIKSTQ